MPRTDYEKTSERIREAIVSGEYAPGERLPQRKLAERYGVTPITVREALRGLAAEGIVRIEPKWGAMVTEISAEKLEGQYTVREALEGMAARLTAGRMSPAERQELTRLAIECDRKLPERSLSPAEKARLHYDLHEEIARLSRCPELVEAIRRLNVFSLLLSNAYHECQEEDPPRWHERLVEPIVVGDEEEAERVMRSHVRRGYRMELERVRGLTGSAGKKADSSRPAHSYPEPGE